MSKYQIVVSQDQNNNFAMSEIAHKNLDLGYLYFIYEERVFKTIKIKNKDGIFLAYSNNGVEKLANDDISYLKSIKTINLLTFKEAYEMFFYKANIDDKDKNDVINNIVRVFKVVCGTMNSKQTSSDLIKMNIDCDGSMCFNKVLNHLVDEINTNL